MLNDSEQKEISKPKHSKLSKITLCIFLSSSIPYIFLCALAYGKIPMTLSYNQCMLFSSLISKWVPLATILSIILSIMDLRKPNRSRIIPRIILTIICTVIIAAVASSFYDIIRVLGIIN